MQNKKIIIVIGNIGVGKTTALPLIAQALDADLIKADEFFQTNPFRDKFLKDKSRWGFTNELYLLNKRTKQIKNELSESQKKIVIIDSGLFMSWVYAKSHYLADKISLDEWLLFDEIFSEWSNSYLDTTILYVTASKEITMLRIKKRRREYEIKLYKKEYLEQLELGLRDFCACFATKVNKIIYVDTTRINLITSKKDKKDFMKYITDNI